MFFEQSSTSEVESSVWNRINQLIYSALKWSWGEWLFEVICAIIILLLFFGSSLTLLGWLWFCTLWLCLTLSWWLVVFTLSNWLGLFSRGFFLNLFRLTFSHLGFLFVFLSLLNFRNNSITILVNFIHLFFVTHTFCDFINSSVNNINERFQWIFVEWVNLW